MIQTLKEVLRHFPRTELYIFPIFKIKNEEAVTLNVNYT